MTEKITTPKIEDCQLCKQAEEIMVGTHANYECECGVVTYFVSELATPFPSIEK